MPLRYLIKYLEIRFFHLLSFRIPFLAILILVFILFPKNVHPFEITLAWDEITEENLVGYKIFYREEGQSYNYTEPAWEGVENFCIISGLDEDITYYFVGRAFYDLGQEGENSNEVRASSFSLSNFGDELAVDFKTAGIYNYGNGTWKRIYHGGIDPVEMVNFYGKLAINFGSTVGLYLFNSGSWTRILKDVVAEKMAAFNGKLAIDFGLSYGIYEYTYETNQWNKIYSNYGISRDSMIGFGDKLVLDFKTSGIYVYDKGIWNRIYNGGIDPVSIVSFDGKLAVDFGPAYGLYIHEYETYTWKRIYIGVPIEKIAAFNDKLAIDFGTSYGLYVYEYDTDTWKRIYKGVAIENMTGFSYKLVIDLGTTFGIYEYSYDTDTWKKIYNANVPRDDILSCDVFD